MPARECLAGTASLIFSFRRMRLEVSSLQGGSQEAERISWLFWGSLWGQFCRIDRRISRSEDKIWSYSSGRSMEAVSIIRSTEFCSLICSASISMGILSRRVRISSEYLKKISPYLFRRILFPILSNRGVPTSFSNIMTYIVPGGSYERYEDEATGRTLVDANSYSQTENTPVSLLQIPYLIAVSCSEQADIIFSVLFVAGALEIILETNMFHVFCTRLAQVCSKGRRERYFIPIMMFVFAVLGLTQSTDRFIAFVPVGVMLAVSMGYDAIVGIAIVLCGVGVSYSAGPLSSVTALAQSIAGLSLYSDVIFRMIIAFGLYVGTAIYTCRYAARIKKSPSSDYLYQVEGVMSFDVDVNEKVEITLRQVLVLIAFVISIVVLTVGCITQGWGFMEIGTVFLWSGFICGLLGGFGPSKMCKIFVRGVGKCAGAALVVGLGATVSTILTQGGIIDTIVHALAGVINYIPSILKAPIMYIVNTLINLLIPSGSGQATVVMPILAPVSDLVGMSRQTTVTAFKLGEGLSNYILPHASALMGFLGLTGVPYDRWMKYMWKLFLLQSVIAMVFCMIGGFIGC